MCLSALEKSKVVETLGACRPLWVLLFPQRVILTRFGRFVIHDSLAATPTSYSLISGVACELAARSEARHALAWERVRLAPKHDMHLSGSAGGSPATYPEAPHALGWERGRLARNVPRSTACTCLGARAACPPLISK